MAKLLSLTNVNIVAIYPNLDLRTLNVEAVRRIADMEDDPYGSTFFSDPQRGMKLMLPQRKVEVDITPSKVQISDVFVQDPEKSDLVSRYLLNLTEILKPYTAQIYGFNYIFNVSLEENKKLLKDRFYKLIADVEYKYQSIAVKFHGKSGGESYLVKLDELNNGKFQVSVNYETTGDIKNIEEVKEKFIKGYKISKEVINEL